MTQIVTQAGFIAAVEALGKASANVVADFLKFVRDNPKVPTIDAAAATPLVTLTTEIAALLAAAPLNDDDTKTLREKTALLAIIAHGAPKFLDTANGVIEMVEAAENYIGHAAIACENFSDVKEFTIDRPHGVIESFLPDTP